MTEERNPEVEAFAELLEAGLKESVSELAPKVCVLELIAAVMERGAEEAERAVEDFRQKTPEWWHSHKPGELQRFYRAHIRYAQVLGKIANLVPPELRGEPAGECPVGPYR